jgi:hypothetical protein
VAADRGFGKAPVTLDQGEGEATTIVVQSAFSLDDEKDAA